MLHFPQTYQNLIAEGIQEDYSMGYPSKPGFRAGTAIAFPWYDLSKEEETTLLVHPLQVMDVTLKEYMDLSPDEAVSSIKNIIEQVRNVHGVFTLCWHNSSFSEIGSWTTWKFVFEDVLKMASK